MKKSILTIITAFCAITTANAQSFWDKTSVEVGYGYAMPLNPTKDINASDYNSFLNFAGGINYEFDNLWGVRLTYAFQDFDHKNNDKFGVTYHKFMAEATFNVLEAFNPSVSHLQSNTFGLQAHAGVGATLGNRDRDNATNQILNGQIGLKPNYTISNRFKVFLDATYVMNFNQAYQFNGASIKGGTTGSYLSANIGVQIQLGK